MKTLTKLTRDDICSFEIAVNKAACAKQAMCPTAIPPYTPVSAADRYFREAIFAYADAEYLQDYFWRDLAQRYGVEQTGLQVDFNTNELFISES
ncbi:MAG: hypothetical protein LBK68_00345 [Candidatus Margulisbacteria bacterium]|jgi:hypothetical protein|nr:hypothetical protein [Candidatus Margulisiibacteriota bacterium]